MDVTSVCWTLLAACVLLIVSAVQKNITAESGQNVTLPCRAQNYSKENFQWNRTDLRDEEYVLLYRDRNFVTANQHLSFKNRVDLQDRQMKDGDLSLILKNVMTADSGTYECVLLNGINQQISNITLSVVVPPGQTGGDTEDGSVGLIVGLLVPAVILVAAVVGFLIYKKHKQQQNKDSYQPPAEQQPV